MIIRPLEPSITISCEEYKKLIADSTRLEAIVTLIKNNKYMSCDDVMIIAGEHAQNVGEHIQKREDEENGRD